MRFLPCKSTNNYVFLFVFVLFFDLYLYSILFQKYRQIGGLYCIEESSRNCLCCNIAKSIKTLHIHGNYITT